MRKLITLTIVVGIFSYCIYKFLSFRVTSVECISQFGNCDAMILKDIDMVNLDNMVKTQNNLKSLLNKNLLVESYVVKPKFDGGMTVEVRERESKYCVMVNGTTYYADLMGLIIKSGKDADDGCLANSNTIYKVGDSLISEDLFAQKLYYELRSINGLGRSYYDGNIYVIDYHNDVKLIFPVEGDAELLAGKVYYSLSQFATIEDNIIKNGGTKVTEIDFRYNNPIVRYS